MINRVLIRIKVIQMLYSYLLTEKLFMLESQPTPPTKEKRFAYKLYLDMLTLMIDISDSVEVKGKKYLPLKDNRFIKVYKQDMGSTEIWVDKETGVNYLYHQSGYSGGLTVLLDKDGKPIVTHVEE